jgi:hypothetical protein
MPPPTVNQSFRLGPRLAVAQDTAVRVASWVFVLCTALGAIAVFLPSIELRLRGSAISKRTQLSLYTAGGERALVRRLLAGYHGSSKRHVGAKIMRTVSPRVGGRVRAALDDAHDAMDTLDEVTDDDVRTAGTLVTVTLWTLLGLDALMIAQVFTELMRGAYRRSRLIAALVLSVAVTAIAIAVHIVCREVVWQANDEVGGNALALRLGAYVIPIAAVAGLLTAIVLVARRRRESLR